MQKKIKGLMQYNTRLLLAPSMEQILNFEMKIVLKHMNSLSDHSNLLYTSPISLLIRIYTGEISREGWLIIFVKHTMWANSFISHICCYFQFPQSRLHPAYPMTFFMGILGEFWFFLKTFHEHRHIFREGLLEKSKPDQHAYEKIARYTGMKPRFWKLKATAGI
jgi:hypothetical protein